MSEGRRRFPQGATVTVEAGGQTVVLTGREAAMVADLALSWRRVAAVPYGTVAFEVTPQTCELWLTDKRQKIWIEAR